MRSSLILASFLPLLAFVTAQGAVPAWGQCGGMNHNGGTSCVSGYTCRYQNDWYSQCVPGAAATTEAPPPVTTPTPTPTPITTTPVTSPTTSPTTSTGPIQTGTPPSAAAGSLQDKMHKNKGGRYVGTAGDQGTYSISQLGQIAKDEFGWTSPENSMKWESTETARGQWNFGGADWHVNWATQNNKKIRGHTLVWHSQLPQWVKNINDRATLTSVIENHVTTLMTRYKGKIAHWDVVNEVLEDNGEFRRSVFYNVLGEEFIAIAFRAARKADPAAKLYINDYNLDYQSAKLTNTIAIVKRLQAAGVPIDGIGSQAHLIVGNGAVGSVPSTLKQLHDTGLEVAITELDIRIQLPADSNKFAQQARDYQTVFNACLALPRCVGVSIWGVDDGHSWVEGTFSGQGEALLWNKSYQKKSAYNTVSSLLN